MTPRPQRKTRYWLGRSTHAWRRDVQEGITLAAVVAAFYSVVSIGYYVLADQAPFSDLGVSLAESLASYWVGGVLSGILYGVLKPLARTSVIGVLVGIVVAAPVFATFGFVSDDPTGWQVAAIMAVIFGGAAGFSIYHHRAIDRQFDETMELGDRLMAGELSDEEIAALEQKYQADLERRKASRRSRHD